MGKRGKIWVGIGAAALAGSLAGNVLLLGRLRNWRMDFGRRPTPVEPAGKPASPASATAPRSKYAAQLPATPILFRRALWRDHAAVLEFDSESEFVSATLTVSPQLPIRSTSVGSRIQVAGDFLPGVKYRLTVAKGAKNASGGTLENDAVVEMQAPDLSPECAFVTSGTYLPLNGKKLVLPFRSVNRDKADVVVYKAFENNLNPYRIGSGESDPLQRCVCG